MSESPIRRALARAAELGMNQTQFAVAIGVTSADVSNWKKRGMPAEHYANAAKALGMSIDVLLGLVKSDAPQTRGVAHDLSQVQQIVTFPSLDWKRLMSTQLPPVFGLVLLDDAMSPDYQRGGLMRFSTTRRVEPGRVVLVADSKGNPYVRKYQLHRAEHWRAVATNPDYGSLDSEIDGLKVLAVMTGWDMPPDEA